MEQRFHEIVWGTCRMGDSGLPSGLLVGGADRGIIDMQDAAIVVGGAGFAALLHVLGLAPLLQRLPGHGYVLLDVLTLLSGHGVAHLVADVAALLIILELGHGGGRVAAVLLEILLQTSRVSVSGLEGITFGFM